MPSKLSSSCNTTCQRNIKSYYLEFYENFNFAFFPTLQILNMNPVSSQVLSRQKIEHALDRFQYRLTNPSLIIGSYPRPVFTRRGLPISPMQAFIRTAAHWEAVGGQGEVTHCDQSSVGFLHNVCVFLFLLATQTDQSQSIIYKATGSAHYFRQRIKAYIGDIHNPLRVTPGSAARAARPPILHTSS